MLATLSLALVIGGWLLFVVAILDARHYKRSMSDRNKALLRSRAMTKAGVGTILFAVGALLDSLL
jgi:hypothetical protein